MLAQKRRFTFHPFIDVKDAFRRVHIKLHKACIFFCVVGECFAIDFMLAQMASVTWMVGFDAAAIFHSHRNTDVNTAVILPRAQLKADDVKFWVPADGLSAMCAPPGVVASKLQGNSEAEFYAEMYVDVLLNLEACKRGNEIQQHFPRFRATEGCLVIIL